MTESSQKCIPCSIKCLQVGIFFNQKKRKKEKQVITLKLSFLNEGGKALNNENVMLLNSPDSKIIAST